MKCALVIVDVQNDFCPPDGSFAVNGGDKIVPKINKLREGKFDYIFLTQDWHPKGHKSFASSNPGKELFQLVDLPSGPQIMWPDHCVQGTKGAEFHPDLVVSETDIVVKKGTNLEVDSYSGFKDNAKESETELEKRLRDVGVDKVYLVGIAYEYCVGFTALDALDCGFETYFVEDCVAGIKAEDMDNMKEKLKEKGAKFIISSEIN